MVNYQKMYAILCGAIDAVIGPLERLPPPDPRRSCCGKPCWRQKSSTFKGRRPPARRRNKPQKSTPSGCFFRFLRGQPFLLKRAAPIIPASLPRVARTMRGCFFV